MNIIESIILPNANQGSAAMENCMYILKYPNRSIIWYLLQSASFQQKLKRTKAEDSRIYKQPIFWNRPLNLEHAVPHIKKYFCLSPTPSGTETRSAKKTRKYTRNSRIHLLVKAVYLQLKGDYDLGTTKLC